MMKWLHLSDLHYNPDEDGRSSDQLRENLPAYLKQQNFCMDEIFITGDFRHAKYQNTDLPAVAKEVVDYILEIAESVGISTAQKIHVLPGNHDLTRDNSIELERIKNSYDYDRGHFSPKDLSDLQKRFNFFYYICKELYGDESIYDEFCRAVHPYFIAGNCVILCMNTCLVCGLDNERGSLLVGTEYLYRSLKNIKQNHPNKEIIILAHHALECLAKKEREQVERLFADYPIILYLCGDAHELWGRKINNFMEITSGCMVQNKGTEVVFCAGNTDQKTITAYSWDKKFAKWSEYAAFNEYINSLTEGSPKMLLPPQVHNLPKLARNYRISSEIISVATSILQKNRLLYISGLSGIGKTSLSIRLSEAIKADNQLNEIYFIDASQIKNAQGLHAVDLDMAGRKVNLIDTIRMSQSLYIIDDLQHDIDNIVDLLLSQLSDDRNCFIIITSQIESRLANSHGLQYSLPFLTDDKDILDILNLYLPKEKHCPKDLIGTIKQKTNGHPLLLNSLRSLIQYGDANWQDLIDEALQDFVYHEVEDGKTFMSQILNRHQETLGRELAAICWLGSKYVSTSLLSKLITQDGIRKLSSRSFIQISVDRGIIKIHDIIFESIIELQYSADTWKHYSDKYYKDFYNYFIRELRKKSALYYKSLHLHESKIIALAKQADKPGVEWYFYSQAFPNDDFDIFKSFSYTDEECKSWLLDDQAKYIIGTLLELMERKSRKERSSDSYKEIMNEQIRTLKLLRDEPGVENSLRLDILHHLGKLYRNIQEIDNAIICFKEILDKHPDKYESKLQLLRIQKHQNKLSLNCISAGYAQMIDTYINGDEISMSVVLAAYEDLYATDKEGQIKKKYFIDKFDYFKQAILSMAVESFDLPYNVLAVTMKYYTYAHPDLLFSLIDKLPIPAAEMVNKGNYFDIAQMYKEIGKAIMWSEKPVPSKSPLDYFTLAEEFYGLLVDKKFNREYQCTQRAENLILIGKYSDAKAILERHTFEESEFWNYRYGQALAGTGENGKREALQYLQKAIDLCKKPEYLASFNHAMANILAELKDPKAEGYYRKALGLCGNNKKYQKQIAADMEAHLQ